MVQKKVKRRRTQPKMNPFSEAVAYVWESRNHIYLAMGIFFAFFLVGLLLPSPAFVDEYMQTFIEELIAHTQGMDQGEITWFIFQNNLTSSFMILFLGILLGIFPVFAAIMNGYVIGYVAGKSILITGSVFILWRLVPHGIFELPAIFIALGLGIRLGADYLVMAQKFIEKNASRLLATITPIVSVLLFPLTLALLIVFFQLMLLYEYIVYYGKRERYFFLIFSLMIFPIYWFNLIFNKNLETEFNAPIISSMKSFLLIILPLLIIAAIIEGALIAWA